MNKMNNKFETENIEVFAEMIRLAVQQGLTFVSSERDGTYCIIYTGGF